MNDSSAALELALVPALQRAECDPTSGRPVLGDLNVEMVSKGANEINLSMVVREADAHEAVRRLHWVIEERVAAESLVRQEGT